MFINIFCYLQIDLWKKKNLQDVIVVQMHFIKLLDDLVFQK